MKRYAKPNQLTNLSPILAPKVKDPLISDISVDSLINDGLLALYREIKNILTLGVGGKLPPEAARDLREHLKMLFEIKDREAEHLQNLSDEQLQDMVIAYLKRVTPDEFAAILKQVQDDANIQE